MGQIGQKFTAVTGLRVKTSSAASSVLAKQIAEGAPADLFLSANPLWMDYLQQRNLLRKESRRNLLANQLVLVAPQKRTFHVEMKRSWKLGDAFQGRLALGDPAHVPAGQYAEAALKAMGWYDGLRNRLVPTLDVRGALSLVETGEAAAGIVYQTDAAISKKIRVLATFPPGSHPPIRYPIALVKNSRGGAVRFLSFLERPEVQQMFKRAQFTPLAR